MPNEIKLTLWMRKGKKADGTEFTSFSTSTTEINGVDSWVDGFRRTANTKNGPVEVIDLVIKPKQPQKTGPMTQAEVIGTMVKMSGEAKSNIPDKSEPPF